MAQVFETTDPELASEIFAGQYTSMRMRIHGARPLFRSALTQVGAARLDRTTFRMALEGSAEPLQAFHILRVRSGTVRYWSDGSEEIYGSGDTCLPVLPGRAWSTRLQDVDSELVVVDQTLLDEAGGGQPGTGRPARLLSTRPYSVQAAARLWHTASAMRTVIAAQPDPDSQPLITGPAARLLAASVLAAFPNSTVPEPTAQDRTDAHPATLRRAVAFIDANPDRDISLIDIARAAYATPRTVQLAFRRHLDTTPTVYLRKVRLQHAHQQLVDATPDDGLTVTRIALDWGFANPGRFAAHYRAAYGQSPSETLNR
jgi:AraC-like DNA-binding protein